MHLNDRARQNSQSLNEALFHLRSQMPPSEVALADRLARLNEKYIGTARDKKLGTRIRALIRNVGGAANGVPSKRRALCVIGESGSGKSTAVQHAIAARKEFAPYEDSAGRLIHPLVTLEAPGSMTLQVLALELLRAIGYPLIKPPGESEAWHLLKEQLVFRKVLFIHIDEMQHALTVNNHATGEHISDTVKSLLQIPNWPLHIIMSGVPAFANFRENNRQIITRSMVMEFERVNSVPVISDIVKRIIEVHAEMNADAHVLEPAFIARLIHAMDGAFGTCIEFTRTTVGEVLSATADSGRKATVQPHHFAEAYANVSACEPSENIFTAKNWTAINPGNALKRMQDAFAHKRVSRKRLKETE